MKIGFDISQLAHRGGVGVYTKNLAAQLLTFPDIDPVFFYSSLRMPYRGNLRNVKNYPIPPTLFELLFNKMRLSIDPFIGLVDVFHSSDWVQPSSKAKKVTTYHDVTPLIFPKWSHPKIVEVHKRRLGIVEREVDLIIAVTQATKKDLLKISNLADEKIIVIYEGVDDRFKIQKKVEVEKFRKKYNLPEEFILAIGGIGERRNILRTKQACAGYHLVITGENLPYLQESEMPLLYSAARILLYPSLYEGFGLPILEAMACGTPVVTSNRSSMIEVGGDAVLLVDPENVEKISSSAKIAFKDEDLRREMSAKGLIRAKEFSWEKCARETVDVYKKAYSG